jgi:general secretion pathway protein H
MSRTVRRGGGFTLLELMAVIAILSLVAVLVFPRLPSMGATELKTSARKLAGAIRYLNDQSVATKTPYLMRIVLADSSIEIRTADTKKTKDSKEEGTTKLDPFLQERFLAEGVTIMDVVTGRLGTQKEGEVSLNFGPGGLRDFVIIHLKGRDENQWTVMAYPSTGRVRVDEGYLEQSP